MLFIVSFVRKFTKVTDASNIFAIMSNTMKSPEFLKPRLNRFAIYGAAAFTSLGLFYASDAFEEKAAQHEHEPKDSVAQETEDSTTAEALDQIADIVGQEVYGRAADFLDHASEAILVVNAISITGEAITALAQRRTLRQKENVSQPNEL